MADYEKALSLIEGGGSGASNLEYVGTCSLSNNNAVQAAGNVTLDNVFWTGEAPTLDENKTYICAVDYVTTALGWPLVCYSAMVTDGVISGYITAEKMENAAPLGANVASIEVHVFEVKTGSDEDGR